MHVIAAKAVCFKEALSDSFKEYQVQVVKMQGTFRGMMARGFDIVSGEQTTI
jgi:glycine hydroxymethyltransferase